MANDKSAADVALASACPAGDGNTVALVAATEMPLIAKSDNPAVKPLMDAYKSGGFEGLASKVCADHGQSFGHADLPAPSATPSKSGGAIQR